MAAPLQDVDDDCVIGGATAAADDRNVSMRICMPETPSLSPVWKTTEENW